MTAPAPAPSADQPRPRIGILGGAGAQGRGLGRRFSVAGYEVVLGSRDAARAQEAAQALAADGLPVTGAANAGAAGCDVVIVAVPYDGHRALLASLAESLAGSVVVDCVNPLGFDAQGAYRLAVPDGSAAEEAAVALPLSTVVGAFHHVSAVLLQDPAVTDLATDVMVVGDDRAATDLVQGLASALPGVRGVYGGRLRNAAQVEALTANLISVNRRHKTHAGVRITGV